MTPIQKFHCLFVSSYVGFAITFISKEESALGEFLCECFEAQPKIVVTSMIFLIISIVTQIKKWNNYST